MLTMRSSPPGEAPVDGRRPRLGGQAAAAARLGQAPAHLDRGEDLGQEVRHREAGPPDELAALTVLERLDAEAVGLVAPITRSRKSCVSSSDMARAERVPPEGRVGVDDREPAGRRG